MLATSSSIPRAGGRRDPDRTRALLLDAAFQEIYKHGYQAASLDNILAKTGVTKGALYHHFRNKRALGYAVVEEVIRKYGREHWVDPLFRAEDPVQCLLERLDGGPRGRFSRRLGCPLNNLAQEMSPLDEGFRRRIEKLFHDWRNGIAQGLRQGQKRGRVRADIDAEAAAAFYLAALEGTISLAKNAKSPSLWRQSRKGLAEYLQTLRPRPKPSPTKA